jgi:hypothetical protein
MNIPPLTTVRIRVEGTVLAVGLLSLLASCGDTPAPPDVDFLPPPAGTGVVESDARAPRPIEQPCDTTQSMQFGGGPGLPPTTFRRIVCDQAMPKSP